MIIDTRNKQIFLATKKTASTAIEASLMQLAYCGHLGGVPQLKRLNYETCIKLKEALNFKEFRTWCVIRHLVDKLIP